MDGCKFSLICLIVVVSVSKVRSETALSSIDTGKASGQRPYPIATDAVSKAAKYLLKRTLLDDELKSFLPRTVVALAFAAGSGSIPKNSPMLLREELNNHIFTRLSQDHLKPTPIELAHYINALVATCQDPSNFQGMNLVEQLRLEVSKSYLLHDLRSPDGVSPFVLLTLCIAGDNQKIDIWKLVFMFDKTEQDNKLDLKALMIMALACPVEKNPEYPRNIHFKEEVKLDFDNVNIYTKALSLQGLHAMGVYDTAKLSLLLEKQLPDGSFGDLLSTYYAIPALLGKSLSDLKCESSSIIESSPLQFRGGFTDTSEVVYSLWVEQGAHSMTHSVTIELNRNETFYDVMRKAEEMNEIFSFRYDLRSNGKKIYSLAGIPNDVETGEAWNLYRGSKGSNKIFSEENLSEETKGVDQIWPKDGDLFVFWFKRW